jgi:ribonuclease Y
LFEEIIVGIICAIIGIIIGYFIRKNISESKIGSAELEAKRIIEEAKQKAETRKKEILWKNIKKIGSDMIIIEND